MANKSPTTALTSGKGVTMNNENVHARRSMHFLLSLHTVYAVLAISAHILCIFAASKVDIQCSVQKNLLVMTSSDSELELALGFDP